MQYWIVRFKLKCVISVLLVWKNLQLQKYTKFTELLHSLVLIRNNNNKKNTLALIFSQKSSFMALIINAILYF